MEESSLPAPKKVVEVWVEMVGSYPEPEEQLVYVLEDGSRRVSWRGPVSASLAEGQPGL